MQGRWPNLFVVGAARAGTTSLWRYLGEHPEIFVSPVKEPNFFCSLRGEPSTEEVSDYLRLFSAARGEKLRAEASPLYLSRGCVPEAIRRVQPAAKIVISLREPVARTHSSYLSLVSDGVERRAFLQAVQDDLARRRVAGCPRYVKPKLYSKGLRRYLKAFGDQVFVLFFEDLVRDPAACLRDLFDFLGVDPSFADRLRATAHNRFRQPRNRAVEQLLGVRRLGRAVVPRPLRDRVADSLTSPASAPKPDEEAVRLLCEAYAPEVAAVRAILGRRLPRAWERRFPAERPIREPPRLELDPV